MRLATESDLAAIVRLLAGDPLGSIREKLEDPLPRTYLSAFHRIQKSPGNNLIVATSDDGLVRGCLQLTITAGFARKGMIRATIEGVRITSELRGSGVGTKVIDHAISEARAAGCGLVQLTTDRSRTGAQQFYERLGFVPSHVGMKLML